MYGEVLLNEPRLVQEVSGFVAKYARNRSQEIDTGVGLKMERRQCLPGVRRDIRYEVERGGTERVRICHGRILVTSAPTFKRTVETFPDPGGRRKRLGRWRDGEAVR